MLHPSQRNGVGVSEKSIIRDNHLLEACPHTRVRALLKERGKSGLYEGPRCPDSVIIQDPVGRLRAERGL